MSPNPDPIDQAIATAEQQEPLAMRQFNITISSTGRPGFIAVPEDITEGELAEFAGGILGPVLQTLRVEREQKRSPIQIVRGSLPKN